MVKKMKREFVYDMRDMDPIADVGDGCWADCFFRTDIENHILDFKKKKIKITIREIP